jgi:hypothetical protein
VVMVQYLSYFALSIVSLVGYNFVAGGVLRRETNHICGLLVDVLCVKDVLFTIMSSGNNVQNLADEIEKRIVISLNDTSILIEVILSSLSRWKTSPQNYV